MASFLIKILKNNTLLFSSGKLLLTSEYMVLDGALALAIPTKLGQDLSVNIAEASDSKIFWNALHENKKWLQCTINFSDWSIVESNLPDAADFILKTLQNVQQLASKSVFIKNHHYYIQTNLQFPADFGLGSSATLMNNLADWAEIDAFQLNEICLGGSGYDIAVAKEKSAILFQNSENSRKITPVIYEPSFKNELIFIHLNQKQNSRKGIAHYLAQTKSPDLIAEFSTLTKTIFESNDLQQFSELMSEHEEIVANYLNLTPVKKKYFENYDGFVKSLGAWGGDFVLASKNGDYQKYFNERGFTKIFEWNDLIL